MNRQSRDLKHELDGLTESERQALAQAQGGNIESAQGADELMARAYAKSGIDPLRAAELRNPAAIMAKTQGPFIAMGGLLLAAVGAWRVWNAWSHSRISIGGISMLVIGIGAIIGGLAGAIVSSDDD